jgi:hypothetical protein
VFRGIFVLRSAKDSFILMKITPMSEEQQPIPPEQNKDEIADYYEDVRQKQLKNYEPGIKKARNALYVAAFIYLLGEVVSILVAGYEFTPLAIVIILAEVGILVALALWTKTKPYAAIIVGIIVMILYWAGFIVLNGVENAWKGILFRVIILVLLFNALKPAKAWEEAQKGI